MLPAARDAHIDFVRLAAEEPSSLYFEDFLRDGFEAWPSCYRNRFAGLSTWPGVVGLKQSLRRLAGAPHDWQVLLGSRSLLLLKLGASCLFRVCRNVLTTDLNWPTYQRTVVEKANRTDNRVTGVDIRERILAGGWTARDVARHIAHVFVRNRCDGLFLPAVDHLGIRLPVREIVERIQAVAELRFCLIDAAQALCHTPLDDSFACADFIVAGSHKWMGACVPTGIAFFGHPRSQRLVMHRLRNLCRTDRVADPLLPFAEQIADGRLEGYSETANLTSLVACAGAAWHHLHDARVGCDSVADIDDALRKTPRPDRAWEPVFVSPEMRSRIAVMQRAKTALRPPSAADVRRDWLNAGCIVSGYDDGRARLAFPAATSHSRISKKTSV